MKKQVNYKIYQTKADWLFFGYNFAKSHGFNFEEYNEVYSSTLDVNEDMYDSDICEELFRIFNIDHPSDFTGHSMSVSDIVKIGNRFFYCDSFGFKDITVDITK